MATPIYVEENYLGSVLYISKIDEVGEVQQSKDEEKAINFNPNYWSFETIKPRLEYVMSSNCNAEFKIFTYESYLMIGKMYVSDYTIINGELKFLGLISSKKQALNVYDISKTNLDIIIKAYDDAKFIPKEKKYLTMDDVLALV